ncbi:MAG: hypothetical protein IPL52_06950 [Flavobacteriales bacterium]|nr:hypothetical protein [Flavobacteriales bacterium]
MLHRFTLLLPLLLVLSASLPRQAGAQTWELVTPVKTRSELPSVRMVDPTTGFMIDRVLGFVMKTTDAGASWERKPYNLIDKPRVLWMWDDQRGIIAANSGRFYRTTDGWATASSVYQPTFGNLGSLFFVNDTWAGPAARAARSYTPPMAVPRGRCRPAVPPTPSWPCTS